MCVSECVRACVCVVGCMFGQVSVSVCVDEIGD